LIHGVLLFLNLFLKSQIAQARGTELSFYILFATKVFVLEDQIFPAELLTPAATLKY